MLGDGKRGNDFHERESSRTLLFAGLVLVWCLRSPLCTPGIRCRLRYGIACFLPGRDQFQIPLTCVDEDQKIAVSKLNARGGTTVANGELTIRAWTNLWKQRK